MGLTAPDVCSQCTGRGWHCGFRCHGGFKEISRRKNHCGAWLPSQLLMSGHQINNLFLSLTRGNLRVICCSSKSTTACCYSLYQIPLSVHDNLLRVSIAAKTPPRPLLWQKSPPLRPVGVLRIATSFQLHRVLDLCHLSSRQMTSEPACVSAISPQISPVLCDQGRIGRVLTVCEVISLLPSLLRN